jgi:ABC-type phosphate transport system substrate-binding protein
MRDTVIVARRILAIIGMLWLSAAPVSSAPVRVSGAPSFNETVFQPYKGEIEQEAGLSITVISINSERGIDDLFAGRADIAMLGARLDAVVKTISAKRSTSYDASRLVEHVIGESHIDFVVNPGNSVKSVKRNDLAAILGGKTGSWAAVGGNAHPILVAVEPTDAMYQHIQNTLLSPLSLTWTPRSRVVESILQIPSLIGQAPDAIGYMNSLAPPDQKRRVAILDTDVMLGRLQVLVTLNNTSPDAQRVVAATKTIISRMIAQSGTK